MSKHHKHKETAVEGDTQEIQSQQNKLIEIVHCVAIVIVVVWMSLSSFNQSDC